MKFLTLPTRYCRDFPEESSSLVSVAKICNYSSSISDLWGSMRPLRNNASEFQNRLEHRSSFCRQLVAQQSLFHSSGISGNKGNRGKGKREKGELAEVGMTCQLLLDVLALILPWCEIFVFSCVHGNSRLSVVSFIERCVSNVFQ